MPDRAAASVEVVSDQDLVRCGLGEILRAGGLHVTGDSEGNCSAADVVLYDATRVQAPAPEDLEALLRGRTPVLVLVSASTAGLPVNVAEAACLVGIVDLSTPARGIVESVRGLADGRTTPGLLVDGHGLTPREVQIMCFIASGRSNKEIARELFLSINSVKTYIRTAYRKLGVNRRSQAVLWAAQRGLLVERGPDLAAEPAGPY